MTKIAGSGSEIRIRIWIRIHNKMSWIRNTAQKHCFFPANLRICGLGHQGNWQICDLRINHYECADLRFTVWHTSEICGFAIADLAQEFSDLRTNKKKLRALLFVRRSIKSKETPLKKGLETVFEDRSTQENAQELRFIRFWKRQKQQHRCNWNTVDKGREGSWVRHHGEDKDHCTDGGIQITRRELKDHGRVGRSIGRMRINKGAKRISRSIEQNHDVSST